MNKIVGFLVLFFLSFQGFSAKRDSLEISIYTCSTGKEISSAFGHTAIRVVNKTQKSDLV